MWQLKVDHAVSAVVEAMLPRFSGNRGVLVTLDLRVSDYSEDDDNFECETAHLLFVRPNNYTKVMCALGTQLYEVKPEDWKMTSDHDSGWTSDGFRMLDKVYWDLREKVPKGKADCWIRAIKEVTVELEEYKDPNRGLYASYRPARISDAPKAK